MPVVSGGYKFVLTGIDTYSKLGFAYPVVDTNAQCTMKGPEQKIVYQWPLYQGAHFHLEQWFDRKLEWTMKHLCQRGGDKDMKGWLTYTPSLVCDHTQHEGVQGMVPIRQIPLLFWGREGLGKMLLWHTFYFRTLLFSPMSPQFSPSDVVVLNQDCNCECLLVLYVSNPTLYERKWTGWEALAKQVLLVAIWITYWPN